MSFLSALGTAASVASTFSGFGGRTQKYNHAGTAPSSGGFMDFVSSVAPTILGAVSDNYSRKNAQEQYGRRLQTTVADARAAGIHPLEAIRSGAANSAPQSGPRLMTQTALTNSFDRVADLATGRTAAENANRDIERQMNRINLDIAKTKLAQQSTKPRIEPRFGQNPQPGLGNPNEIGDLEVRPAGVTNPTNINNNDFQDPTEPDVEDKSARHGDAEIFQTIWAFQSVANEQDYNAALEMMAPQLNLTKKELHERIKANPELRDALPSRVARMVLNLQALKQSWGDTTTKPQGPAAPRPPRIPTQGLDIAP